MTHISPLAVGAFACNSHVTNVTFKTIKYIGANTKVSIFLFTYMLFAVNAYTLMQTATIQC